jgi:hypothetical protein
LPPLKVTPVAVIRSHSPSQKCSCSALAEGLPQHVQKGNSSPPSKGSASSLAITILCIAMGSHLTPAAPGLKFLQAQVHPAPTGVAPDPHPPRIVVAFLIGAALCVPGELPGSRAGLLGESLRGHQRVQSITHWLQWPCLPPWTLSPCKLSRLI